PRPDRSAEPVSAVIGKRERFVFVFDDHDGEHRTEGLVDHYLHVVVDVDQDRRLVRRAAETGVSPPPDQHTRALGDSVSDLLIDDIDLLRPDHRADILRAVTVLLQLSDRGDGFVDELVGDAAHDIATFGSATELPGVEHRAIDDATGRAFNVRVGADDRGIFAAELQRKGDEVAPAGGADLSARRR